MPRRRRHLADLEAQLADARFERDQREGVWRERYVRQIASLIPRVAEARRRVPAERRRRG